MKVYQYGLRPPTLGADLVREQLRLAHEYRCDLTAAARGRRAVERDIELHAGLDAERAELARCEAVLLAALGACRTAKVRDGSRTAPPAERAAVKAARSEIKAARSALAGRRHALLVQLQPDRDRISLLWCDLRRSYRAHYSARGLRHGTYTAVEDAIDRACSDTPLWNGTEPNDPRFPRWTGEGSIGVQLQGGRALDEVLDGADSFLQIATVPDRLGRAGGPQYATLRLRVGTNTGASGRLRDPDWAEWPAKLHRLPPEGSRIKRAMVSCRREGPRMLWTLELTVDEPDGYGREVCGSGMVAVDIGWRRLEGDRLRVAAWRDEAGEHGTVVLDERTIGALRRPELLRSTRDRNLEQMRQRLCAWFRGQIEIAKAAKRPQDFDPEWLRARTARRRDALPTMAQAVATIAQWRAPAKFAALCSVWARQGWADDGEGWALLANWARQDRHLWDWESGQRGQALRARREQYRLFAAWLTRTYGTIVLERFDLRTVAATPPADETQSQQAEQAQSWRQLASTSELRLCIVGAAKARGAEVVQVAAAWSTQDCPRCDHAQTWDAAASIDRRPPCPACGWAGDQDDGACIVLLRRACERSGDVPEPGGARGRRKRSDYGPPGETRWQRVARLRAEKEARMGTARETGVTCA